MSFDSYQILFIAAETWRNQMFLQMLSEAECPRYSVRSESDSRMALARVASETVDAIVLDMEAKDRSALAPFAEFCSRHGNPPLLVLVSKDELYLGKEAMELGAGEFLLKETLSKDLLQKAMRYLVERNRAKALARECEHRFDELFENTKDILFTMDLDGRVTSVNKAAEQVMGWPRSEALQKNIKGLVAPEHVALCDEMMRRILSEEPFQQFEIAMVRKDGRKVLLEASARLLCSNGKKEGVQGIARDVTERRQLESMVQQSQKLEAIGRLSGGLAHDFNNLLCVITGHTELLTEQLETPAAMRSVTQIRKAADSAAALTRQLLAFSRRQVFYPQVVNLNSIVKETEKLLERLIDERIEIYTALDPAVGHVRVDPVQVEQVIINLVLNARDAMPQGGKLTIETNNVDLEEEHRSNQSHVPAGKYVLLAVTDTGCGMSEETRSHIFEPFYTTKELGQGTGLGLATVYGIVKQSGGFIWVYSEKDRGTSFKVYLPRVAGSQCEESTTRPHAKLCAGTETILVVEDAEPLRTMTKEFLVACGYTVLEAADGEEALRIARSAVGPIDLLLTDVVMPRMCGEPLVAQMKKARPETRVLYMSGYPNDGIVQAGILADGVVLLQKPFTREILMRRVRQALDEAKQAIRS